MSASPEPPRVSPTVSDEQPRERDLAPPSATEPASERQGPGGTQWGEPPVFDLVVPAPIDPASGTPRAPLGSEPRFQGFQVGPVAPTLPPLESPGFPYSPTPQPRAGRAWLLGAVGSLLVLLLGIGAIMAWVKIRHRSADETVGVIHLEAPPTEISPVIPTTVSASPLPPPNPQSQATQPLTKPASAPPPASPKPAALPKPTPAPPNPPYVLPLPSPRPNSEVPQPRPPTPQGTGTPVPGEPSPAPSSTYGRRRPRGVEI